MSSSIETKGTKMTPKGQIITGYKATDKNMCCNRFQFELGVWYERDGEIELCKSGFHFCTYPSGPWEYYGNGRLFKCEAELVILSAGPGADFKHVAKRIRLIEEIFTDTNNNAGNRNTGDGNAGDRNTGYKNTGDWNAGDRNAGDGNAGNRNTGDGNAGNRNTGDGNAGDWNAGDRNTGDGNAGDRNTGDGNAGNGNTGDGNAGNRNTGYGNCGDFHSGDLNIGEAPYYIFGEKTDREKVDKDLIRRLASLLCNDDDFDPTPFLTLPNATVEKIKTLHEAHKAARRNL